MASWTPSERSRAKGGLWSAVPTTSRSLDSGCQILPWSWQSSFFLTGISHGSSSRRETNSENHVWEGQNGAIRRRRSLHVFTLCSTVGMSLTRAKAYSFMSGQGCASASIPREAGWERENQREHWVDSCDAKRSTSAARNLYQIRSTVRRFSIHSPDLSFCLKNSATMFRTPETWTTLRDKNLSCAQRRSWRTCLFRVHEREHPWRLIWDTTATFVLMMTCGCVRNRRKWTRARWLFMCS